jgi:hypothetical protein
MPARHPTRSHEVQCLPRLTLSALFSPLPSSGQVPDLAGEGRCPGFARSEAEGRDRANLLRARQPRDEPDSLCR